MHPFHRARRRIGPAPGWPPSQVGFLGQIVQFVGAGVVWSGVGTLASPWLEGNALPKRRHEIPTPESGGGVERSGDACVALTGGEMRAQGQDDQGIVPTIPRRPCSSQ
ncbi:MAG TPA: hypothetical protein VF026_11700, partial [Ktedonobacteraceae bacterium]